MRYLLILFLLTFTNLANAKTPEHILTNRPITSYLTEQRQDGLSLYHFKHKHYDENTEDIFVSHVTFDRREVGSINLEFIGIHDFATNQIKARLKNYTRRQIRVRYNLSNMSPNEASSKLSALNYSHNPYGQWWDRPWWKSFKPEKGGAPYKQKQLQLGQDFNLPDWTIITWPQKQIAKLGDIWVTNDHIYEGIEDGNALTIPGESSQSRQSNAADLNKSDGKNDIDVIIDQTPWFLGKSYHFRFKPSLRIGVGQTIIQLVDEVSIKFVIELFMPDHTRQHFGNITFFIRHNIPKNDTLLSITFDLISW